MSLKETITSAQIAAMKEKNADLVATLRMLTAAIKNKEIDTQKPLEDAEVEEVIRRQVKQLQDALTDFTTAGRTDLVEQSQREISVLSAYLPAQLTDEELMSKVRDILSSAGDVQMGQAMGLVVKELKGQADGNRIKNAVTAVLQK